MTILIVIINVHSLLAQQDPLVTANNSNLIYYMPGSIGRLPYFVTNLLFRKQWGQLPETPTIQMGNIQTPFSFERMSAALQFQQESYKDFNNKSIKIFYAYKIRFAKGKLVAGIEGGVSQYGYSLSNLLIRDEGDDLLSNATFKIVPDVGLGVFYYDSNLELGGSVKHVNNPRLDLNGPHSNLRTQYYAYGSRKFHLNHHYYGRPYTLLRYLNGQTLLADLLMEISLRDYLQISAGIRTQKHLVFQTNFNLNKLLNSSQLNYTLSYSVDFAYMSEINLSSNEIMLTIKYRKRPDPSRIKKRNKISSPLLF